MRCFIAINLEKKLRADICRATEPLRKTGADVKWIDQENLHITLKFLGKTTEERAYDLINVMGSKSLSHNAFEINLHGIGAFPDWRRPRVIWIGIVAPERLIRLHENVEEIAATLGYNRDKRAFLSHLTIGRVRSFNKIDSLMRAAGELKQKNFGNIRAGRISLMKSELKTGGAEYTTLSEFELNKEEQ